MKVTVVELPPEAGDSGIQGPGVYGIRAQPPAPAPAAAGQVLRPGEHFGPYRVLHFVAAGGMGEIYAAERKGPQGTYSRPVALKVIRTRHLNDERVTERFKREAFISGAIQSPHVVRVYEFGQSEDGHDFLSMELLHGEELYQRLQRERTLGAVPLVETVLQVLAGLYAIHQAGFVHRDIKPENVYLASQTDGSELVKLLDFGIAKEYSQKSDPFLSVMGQIYGTPQYLAPEQALDPNVDPRADLYSVAVIMYECLAGHLPFDGPSPPSIIMGHQLKPVPALGEGVDAGLAAIIYKALEKRRDDRYKDAREMGQALSRWLENARKPAMTFPAAPVGASPLPVSALPELPLPNAPRVIEPTSEVRMHPDLLRSLGPPPSPAEVGARAAAAGLQVAPVQLHGGVAPAGRSLDGGQPVRLEATASKSMAARPMASPTRGADGTKLAIIAAAVVLVLTVIGGVCYWHKQTKGHWPWESAPVEAPKPVVPQAPKGPPRMDMF